MDNFKLELLTQNWIDNKLDNEEDLCSHGKILLRINNIILSSEDNEDWTIASSALRLMKSAIYGYHSKNDLQLIPCCGYLRLFPSCPTYITWDTKIKDDIVVISNIQYSQNDKQGLKIIDGSFKISYREYATQILNYANKVIGFYSSSIPRKFYDPWEEENYELFWKEFNEYNKILTHICREMK